MALLIRITAEFRPSIGPAICETVKLLKDSEWSVRSAVSYALSESGKIRTVTNLAGFAHDSHS
jgi:HEAT repeat protein